MDGKGYIYSQSADNVKNSKFGKYTVSYNGCGPVSLYNCLTACGRSIGFEDVLKVLEKYILFGGLLGTSSRNMKRALECFGCKYAFSGSKKGMKELLEKGNLFIAHLNNGFMFFKGRHWVMLEKDKDGRIYAYNASKRDGAAVYSSFEEFCRRYVLVGGGSVHGLFLIEK